MEILLFSGSLRKDSLNKKLVQAAADIFESLQFKTTVVDLKTLSIPVYDGDLETSHFPDSIKSLGAMISNSQALFISTPEYNHSIAGSFKNTIDWLSRIKPVPLQKKPVFLAGASPGAFGAIRGLTASRDPLLALGCYLYPELFALPKAHEAFETNGELKDPKTKEKLVQVLKEFADFSKKFMN